MLAAFATATDPTLFWTVLGVWVSLVIGVVSIWLLVIIARRTERLQRQEDLLDYADDVNGAQALPVGDEKKRQLARTRARLRDRIALTGLKPKDIERWATLKSLAARIITIETLDFALDAHDKQVPSTSIDILIDSIENSLQRQPEEERSAFEQYLALRTTCKALQRMHISESRARRLRKVLIDQQPKADEDRDKTRLKMMRKLVDLLDKGADQTKAGGRLARLNRLTSWLAPRGGHNDNRNTS